MLYFNEIHLIKNYSVDSCMSSNNKPYNSKSYYFDKRLDFYESKYTYGGTLTINGRPY